jgi:hypothetical protein
MEDGFEGLLISRKEHNHFNARTLRRIFIFFAIFVVEVRKS